MASRKFIICTTFQETMPPGRMPQLTSDNPNVASSDAMAKSQAQDYLTAKSDALRYNDKENSREEGMKQFLDEKSYRPGYGHFKRKRASG